MTWRERIQAAREQGTFTKEDRSDAGVGRSAPYACCAVGEQADRHGPDLIFRYHEPDHPRTGVRNAAMASMGACFLGAIVGDHFDAAARLLDEIEDLALQLKREAIFDLRPVHLLDGPAIAPGWLCERCGGYWPTVDEALAVPCEERRAA